ncbi:DUF2627 domain-containing protein [Lentibacillus sp. CBA3610]|uniref:DUF2627 domain-containing protein n=1 Tax=Lentibacillus sp. CBA3610 TaxID=2518176 RepID=UPI001595D744|nr:DUF2627 domain-containing protein [Lentibacillus sp. CBA3610]QKY69284.1 DUF2627 domain-containing protein [Lentibacillus sp. CBA3610]
MIRIIAVLMLLIPGLISAYGIKLMRDSIFNEFYSIFFHIGIQFTVGFLLFIGGILFIGGFIVYRDRKKQKQHRNKDD